MAHPRSRLAHVACMRVVAPAQATGGPGVCHPEAATAPVIAAGAAR